MEPNQYGNYLLKYLPIYLSQQSLKIKFFVYMEDYHPKFNSLTKLNQLIEFKIFLIKELFAIYSGQIQLTKGKWASGHLLEEQDFAGVKI